MPISRSKQENFGIWSLSRIVLWYKGKRSNLKQIKAWAKINVISEGKKSGFDAFLILNNDGEGRIEALGPWSSPIFTIVYDHDSVYLYIFSEATLYRSKNKPDYIQRLTGMPLDFSILFDLLVANLPEYLSECSGFFSDEGKHPFFCISCEEQCKSFKARIMIRDLPVLKEMTSTGKMKHENFIVKYFELGEQYGYSIPQKVHFQWSEGEEWHISFISFKVNQPVSKDTFVVDETWFQGKIINLEDSDP